MENNYIIYQHKNKINGKMYIGLTKQNPITRWRNGRGYAANKHFSEAIQKYGWDNFEHTILYTNLTKEEAGQKEKELIELYNLTDPDKGYNISKGGTQFGPSNFEKMTEWAREHRRMGAESQFARKVRCKETGEVFGAIVEAENWCNSPKICDCCIGRRAHAGYHPETGEQLSWEYAEEDAEITIRCQEKQNNPFARKGRHKGQLIICKTTGEIFNSYQEAEEAYPNSGASKCNISRCCKGIRQSSGRHPETNEKLVWAYIEKETQNEGN